MARGFDYNTYDVLVAVEPYQTDVADTFAGYLGFDRFDRAVGVMEQDFDSQHLFDEVYTDREDIDFDNIIHKGVLVEVPQPLDNAQEEVEVYEQMLGNFRDDLYRVRTVEPVNGVLYDSVKKEKGPLAIAREWRSYLEDLF